MQSRARAKPALTDAAGTIPFRQSAVGSLQHKRSFSASVCQSSKVSRLSRFQTAVCAAAPAAAPSKPSKADQDKIVDSAVATLERAAAKRNVPAPQVVRAVLAVEKARLQHEDWPQKLGSGPNGGSRWRLIFTANKDQIKAVQKESNPLIPGFYIPVPTVQRWDDSNKEIQNGIYLGHIAALTFKGSYSWKKNLMTFNFTDLDLKLGPKWFNFDLTPKDKAKEPPKGTFSFIVVNDNICVARGKAGGFGMWQKADFEWLSSAGVA